MNKLIFLLLLGFFSCTQLKESVKQESNPIRLRVMAYNVGDFSGSSFENGSEDGIMLIREAIMSQKADLIGLQEDVANYGIQSPRDVLYDMYDYYYREGGTMYNYKAFASVYPISNVRPIYYSGDTFGHTFFLAGQLDIEGNRKVLVVSFHFDWADNYRRGLQIEQVIKYASIYEYVILMGDTNCVNYVAGERVDDHYLLYDIEWAIFADNGYTMANNGEWGLFSTVCEGGKEPVDNIFVKGNIEITDSFISQRSWMNDHCMLVSDLLLF